MKESYDEEEDDDSLAGACRDECAKSNSVAFAVSYVISDIDESPCLCYSDRATWTASGVYADSKMCYSMKEDGDSNMQMLGYGSCAIENFNKGPVVTDHIMKRCQQEEPHFGTWLRGSVSAAKVESLSLLGRAHAFFLGGQ